MDKEEFRKCLEQVAVVKDRDPVQLLKNRVPQEYIVEVDEEGNETLVPVPLKNPTLGVELVELKPIHKVCELGCGNIIANQVVLRQVYYSPIRHWRTQCKTCNKYVSPDGQGFIDSAARASAAFIRYFKKSE